MYDNFEEDKISGKMLIVASLLPIVGILVIVSSIKRYLSGISFADEIEQSFSSLSDTTIPNESHVTGIVVENFNSLGLFHPFFIVFVGLLFVSLYMFVLIKYFKQKKAIKRQ